MTKSEALPIVAWDVPSARMTPDGWHDGPWQLVPSAAVAGATPPGAIALTDHTQATAQLQQMALDHLASEGRWIEHTGKLSEQVAALQAEVERLRVDAERYGWLRAHWAHLVAHTDAGGHVLNISETRWGGTGHDNERLDAAIDAALLAHKGE